MVGSAAAVYAHNDPVMSACTNARNSDAEIRDILDGYNDVIIDHIVPVGRPRSPRAPPTPSPPTCAGWCARWRATTAFTLSGESAFVGPDRDIRPPCGCWRSCGCGHSGGGRSAASCRYRRYRRPMAYSYRGQEAGPARRAESGGPPRCVGPRRGRAPTDINADGLAQTVADVRAIGACRCPGTAPSTSPTRVAHLADRHPTHHGAMDIVCNIAGISAWGTVDHLTHQHWRSMIDVNLMGPVHVIETFLLPMMAAGRGGRLVNVLGGGTGRAAVARRLQRQQVRICAGCRRCSGSTWPGTASGSRLVVPGAVNTRWWRPCTSPASIATIPGAAVGAVVHRPRGARREGGRQDPAGIAKNSFLIYTSADIRALYAFKRLAWRPYSAVMTRAQRRSSPARCARAVPGRCRTDAVESETTHPATRTLCASVLNQRCEFEPNTQQSDRAVEVEQVQHAARRRADHPDGVGARLVELCGSWCG